MKNVKATELRRTLFKSLRSLSEPVAISMRGRTVATLTPSKVVKQRRRPEIDMPKIRRFCDRHGILELSLFGSILRKDFGPKSDVDVMVDLPKGKSMYDLVDMQEELEKMFGRKVDLLTKAAVMGGHSEIRKRSILEGSKVIYVQA